MGRKKKAEAVKEVKKTPAQKQQRRVSPDRIAEREGQGWKLVEGVPALRNGSVLMEK